MSTEIESELALMSKFERIAYKYVIKFFSILLTAEFAFMVRFQGLNLHTLAVSINEFIKGAL